ncbi:MAG: ABC transporter ATP-binding protein [Bradymonadaceae bacterium]
MKIRIKGLSRYYGRESARTTVLDDVNLDIDAGEFVAIIGTSGSGKTTLLNVVGGLDRSFDGKVSVGDHDLGSLKENALSRLRNRHFGFVFQQFNLLDHLSAEENVALPHYFGESGSTPPLERARELLGRMGLADRADARPPELSGGQKQRLAIARSLFFEPSIILCDEPTGSLDRVTGLQIMDIFEELNREEGITLVVVTHEEYIARMARRIIRLEDGVVVQDTSQTPVRPSQGMWTEEALEAQ